MKWSNIALSLILIAALANIAIAQYWFQTGARAGNAAAQNNGASVTIETVPQENISSGSMAFWVGEDLQNEGFVQVGYTVENQTGYYPTNCTLTGCSGRVYITAGTPTWFYEYFLPGKNSTFLGAIGPDGSAGPNYTFHTYSFYSLGNTWYFLFDGKIIGTADMGTDSSGPNPPVAIGELANSSGVASFMKKVIFYNLSVYKYDTFLPVQKAYGVVSYGVGSETAIPNPYGVEEVDDKVNYFEVGSGLPTSTNGSVLWTLGYYLKINSKYANISSNYEYAAYSTVGISAPPVVQINNTARAVFEGWSGRGVGSYTGPDPNATVVMYSNITENAVYVVQYRINVTPENRTFGSGWYNQGSVVRYGVKNSIIYTNKNNSARLVFVSWSNGNKNTTGTYIANAPEVISAEYVQEYLINATAQYGNVSGAGWHIAGSKITIAPTTPVKAISNKEVFAFYAWSNGSIQRNLTVIVSQPLHLIALYKYEYRVSINAHNAYEKPITVNNYTVSGEITNNTPFLGNGTYTIEYAIYKGTEVPVNRTISVSGPESINITLPVYNVYIKASDLFGLPVNATLYLTFANGTKTYTSTGNSGEITLYNVPLGSVSGHATYFISTDFKTSGGKAVSLTFISAQNILVIVVLTLALVSFALWLRRERLLNVNNKA